MPLPPKTVKPERVPEDHPPIRVALVSCGQTKLAYPAPARDLYTGPLFRSARAFVEAAVAARRYDAWYIISAEHYLVRPTEVLAPYDMTMAQRDTDRTRQWAIHVDSGLRCTEGYGLWLEQGGRLEVDVYAGAAYVEPLTRWSRLDLFDMHKGLQLGERREAFRLATEALVRREDTGEEGFVLCGLEGEAERLS